jgi:hypothetical protein
LLRSQQHLLVVEAIAVGYALNGVISCATAFLEKWFAEQGRGSWWPTSRVALRRCFLLRKREANCEMDIDKPRPITIMWAIKDLISERSGH